jgi:hypothetical protein
MMRDPSHHMEDADDAELDARMRARMRPAGKNERRPMTERLIRLILGAGIGLLLGGQLVIAADRIDLFDTKSNRAGYIIVDTKSHRTGSGRGRLPGRDDWKR